MRQLVTCPEMEFAFYQALSAQTFKEPELLQYIICISRKIGIGLRLGITVELFFSLILLKEI